MKSINRVTLMGHIVADPLIKTTKSGKKVSTFALATNNEWFDANGELKRSVDFHRIVAWEKLADLCEKYLKKGTPIYLEGRLSNRSYEGKDASAHFITEVIGQSVNILRWQEKSQALESTELAEV